MSVLLRKPIIAAVGLLPPCLCLIGPGSAASFVSSTTSRGQVSTGTFSITSAACTEAERDWEELTGGGGADSFTACEGPSGQPCQASSVSSQTVLDGSGFQSTTVTTVGELSDRPSDLPTAVPLTVSSAGSLPATALHLALAVDPVDKADSGLSVTVLYDGTVVTSGRTLSAVTSTGVELLTGGRTLPPSSHGLIQIDLASGSHQSSDAGDEKGFTLTLTLTGSD